MASKRERNIKNRETRTNKGMVDRSREREREKGRKREIERGGAEGRGRGEKEREERKRVFDSVEFSRCWGIRGHMKGGIG